ARLGLDHAELDERLPRTGELPFDSDRKRMSTVHQLPGAGYRVICKGAPEVLLNRTVLLDDPEVLEQASDWANRQASEGYRVLAVAAADRAELPAAEEEFERDLWLIGLVAIVDPPRSAA
ncbi:ATPase, partial [Nocardia cyriacigeorgica]|nr:ATPase [Nocardia cyriacigeorgica]